MWLFLARFTSSWLHRLQPPQTIDQPGPFCNPSLRNPRNTKNPASRGAREGACAHHSLAVIRYREPSTRISILRDLRISSMAVLSVPSIPDISTSLLILT